MTYTTTYTIRGITHKWVTNNKIDGVDANGVLHMTSEEDETYNLLLEMLEWFQGAAKANDIKWFAMCGTLLGSCRNNGIIPHDNDIDLGVNISEYFKLKQLCDDKSGKYIIRMAEGAGFHINRTNGQNYPFIDVFPMAEENGRMIYAAPFYKDKPLFYTSRVFPLEWIDEYDINNLKTSKFEHLTIPIPNNSDKWLKRVYGDDCYTRYVPDERIDFLHKLAELPVTKIEREILFVIRDVLSLDKSENPDAHFGNLANHCLSSIFEMKQDPMTKLKKNEHGYV